MLEITSCFRQIANALLEQKRKRFSIVTLGCKVNQAESQDLYIALRSAGHIHSESLADSEIVFINTCAVTAEAEAKTRKAIRRAMRCGAPAVIVMGCASEIVRKQMEQEAKAFGSNVAFLNTEGKIELIKILSENTDDLHLQDGVSIPRTRAFVKIQDGCNQKCSYCVVPYLRGRERSIDREEIFRKLELLDKSGVKEIVLTGIHLGRYETLVNGKKYSLADLLKDMVQRFGFRVRLSSIDVFEIDDELIRTVSELKERICPHFHVPLQSGSNRILRLMKRPYTAEHFLSKIEELRNRIGLVAISTDVMVGFPGETEEDFEKTVEVVRKAEFMKLHVFRFSRRQGTDAFVMENQVNENTKKLREEKLIKISEFLGDSFRKKLNGLTAEALVERKRGGIFIGKTEYYADVKISTPVKVGEMYRVKIKYDDGELVGEVER